MTAIDEILTMFRRHGGEAYFGENVSQLEHALQAAALADAANAPPALICAALLHDIGHLVHDLPEDVADQGIDSRHEDIGNAWLSAHFGESVTAPVRLHVAAKRYLCATRPDYFAQLSPASIQSLQLQGGPMTPEEVTHFENEPRFSEAVELRLWDDQAKIPGWRVPDLDHYIPRLEKVLEGR